MDELTFLLILSGIGVILLVAMFTYYKHHKKIHDEIQGFNHYVNSMDDVLLDDKQDQKNGFSSTDDILSDEELPGSFSASKQDNFDIDQVNLTSHAASRQVKTQHTTQTSDQSHATLQSQAVPQAPTEPVPDSQSSVSSSDDKLVDGVYINSKRVISNTNAGNRPRVSSNTTDTFKTFAQSQHTEKASTFRQPQAKVRDHTRIHSEDIADSASTDAAEQNDLIPPSASGENATAGMGSATAKTKSATAGMGSATAKTKSATTTMDNAAALRESAIARRESAIARSKSATTSDEAISTTQESATTQHIQKETEIPGNEQEIKVVYDPIPEGVSELIISHTILARQQYFKGKELYEALLNAGLVYGEMNIFHYPGDEQQKTFALFSVANVVEPGTFDLEQADSFTTPGISMFMRLPTRTDSFEAYEEFIHIAQFIASELDGELCDETRSQLTQQAIGYKKEQIRKLNFELAKAEKLAGLNR